MTRSRDPTFGKGHTKTILITENIAPTLELQDFSHVQVAGSES